VTTRASTVERGRPEDSSVRIHESEFYEVFRTSGSRVVKVVRLARGFESALDVELGCGPLQLALDLLGRRAHTLLVDSRGVVGRNDPTSEALFREHRRDMLLGFRRAAILVRTPAGLLQARRLLVEDGTEAHARAFLDEAEALAYLAEAD
jgi:hypothetical protein